MTTEAVCPSRELSWRRRDASFGLVHGRTVYAYAQDVTVFGGALGECMDAKSAR